MSKSNTFETDLLKLIFNNVAIANIGDVAGLQPSATEGFLYVSLHTSDPAESASQTANETAYTNYARVAVERSTDGWVVASGSAENADAIGFPTCGVTGATITHFGIGTDSSGAGYLLGSGALDAPLAVSNGITPQFSAGSITWTED